MTYLNNLTVQQIIARIEEKRDESCDAIKDICVCLLELSKRNVKHPLHQDKVYRWYAQIASDKLHAGLAAAFNGNARYLDHVVGRNMDLQKSMFAGFEYEIVRPVGDDFKVVRKNVLSMSLSEFQRIFPKGGSPATVSEQRASLSEQRFKQKVSDVESRVRVIVSTEQARLLIGKKSIDLQDVISALGEVGYEVVLRQQ